MRHCSGPVLGNRERQGGEGSESWKYINVMASKAKVVQEATCFMAACYGEKNKPSTMTALRQRVWKDKTGRANIVSAPNLQSLPPTDESFLLNAIRAHFQACI